ncbi:MAG: hypothetical protein N2Z73_01385, partial [Endomicrobia bacterium]|nr:hypothetical protein [Endomicrobiia bacterium]
MKKIDFLILAIVCIFVFADTVRVPFLWDDISLIEENPNVRKFNLKLFFTQSYWREFRKTGSPFERPIKPVS